jgi:hypothetical protein
MIPKLLDMQAIIKHWNWFKGIISGQALHNIIQGCDVCNHTKAI